MEALLSAKIEVPYWCSFKVPFAVNVQFTYPVPPITTVKGLIAAALGYPADYLTPLEDLSFGVGIEQKGELVETYSKIIKWDRRDLQMRTLVMRQKIIAPQYAVYVKGDRQFIKEIAAALNNPAFPLFLGESDDFIEINDVKIHPLKEIASTTVHNCLPMEMGQAQNEDVLIADLPVSFIYNKRGSPSALNCLTYYIAPEITLKEQITAYVVGNKKVVL